MKTKISLLLCLILSFSCNNKSGSKDKVMDAKVNSIDASKNDKSVFGTWQICKMISDEMTIAYNVCPTIVFLSNGDGRLELSEKKMCVFRWIMKNNIIEFSFKSEEDKILFIAKDTEFNFNIYDKGDLQIFELIQGKNRYKYILSRVK